MAERHGQANSRWTIRAILPERRARDLRTLTSMRHVVRWAMGCLLIAFAAVPSKVAFGAGNAAAQVRLPEGVLEGIHSGPSPDAVAFLGVPFAAAPLDERRWMPPQPVRPWTGTREAKHFGPACPQLPATWLASISWDEDCLYLNLWSPRLAPAAKRLPVIVYFHGGSNTAGYSQMTPLGPTLSRLGVLVVSANYRLGPLGFLAHPALTAESEHQSSGNYGLLDQLQALKWVHEHIDRFGGDARRVTVLGQSAGAVDICLLMVSPLSVGLFQHAILESGDCQGALNQELRTPQLVNGRSGTAEDAGKRLASALGVAEGPDVLQQLRRMPAEEILKVWSHNRQISFGAIVDGWIVPEQPAKLFAEGRELSIPVLTGSNADEATVFGHGGPTSLDEYRRYLVASTGKYADLEFRSYPAKSDGEVATRYLQLQSDEFAYGAYSLVRAITRAGQKGFLYQFSFVETGARAALGAYHGAELNFLSDRFPEDWQHSAEDEQLGRAIRTYWVRFAKTGNPNAANVPDWPPYDAQSDQYLDLGRTIGLRRVAQPIHALAGIMNQVLFDATDARSQPQ
jgi:para-nitrobenzyl esterase